MSDTVGLNRKRKLDRERKKKKYWSDTKYRKKLLKKRRAEYKARKA
jgi:hypothetical protein